MSIALIAYVMIITATIVYGFAYLITEAAKPFFQSNRLTPPSRKIRTNKAPKIGIGA